MKTKDELSAIKEEVDALNKKLSELTEEELAEVAGGAVTGIKNMKEREIAGFFGGIVRFP